MYELLLYTTRFSLPAKRYRMPLSPNYRGALFMALAMMSFTTNDTMVKYLAETMPMGQIVFVRNMIASVVIILIAYKQHAMRPLRLAFSPYIAIRVIGEVGGTITFLIGLSHIPIGNAAAIMQALPLAVTMGAALFLGEPVGWRRWSARECIKGSWTFRPPRRSRNGGVPAILAAPSPSMTCCEWPVAFTRQATTILNPSSTARVPPLTRSRHST